MENRKQIFSNYFEATNIPIRICSSAGELFFACPFIDEPEEPADFYQMLIKNFITQLQGENLPVTKLVSEVFFFAVFQLYADQYLIVGPVAPIRFDDEHIIALAIERKIFENRFKIFCDATRGTPIMSYRRFLSCVALAAYLYNGSLINIDGAILTRDVGIQEQEKFLTNKLFDLQEEKVISHTPYSFEQGLLSAVIEGNEATLRQRMDSPISGDIGQMSLNEIQQQKYTFVTFTALVTRAAIKGGLSQEIAFSMSDMLIQNVDRIRTPDEFAAMTYNMVLQFTRKVAETKGLVKLSRPVRISIEYINSHLHQEIYTYDLARIANLTPRVLSQKFSKEMNCSISEYINLEKMNEAKSLLQYTDYSISEIGSYLQYNSQSYFTTVFKRFCNMTPQQYRDKFSDNIN